MSLNAVPLDNKQVIKAWGVLSRSVSPPNPPVNEAIFGVLLC